MVLLFAFSRACANTEEVGERVGPIRRAALVSMLALLCLAFPSAPRAATPGLPGLEDVESLPVHLRADHVEYERSRDLYVASGNVEIHQGARTLTADWVSFSNRTRTGVASGNVVVRDATEQLRADFLQFDVDTLEGVYYDGTLEGASGAATLEGGEVRKEGENAYTLKDFRFTTCDCPDKDAKTPWQVRGEKADLEVGGYGTVKNASFDVLDTPIMWFPWMIFPLKTERQTGFLFPEIGGSSFTGTEIALPFFWAPRDNINVLLTPRYLSKRGWKPEVQTEYVFGEESGGSVFGTYLRDQGKEFEDPDLSYGADRWFADAEHDQLLGAGWRLNADMKFASDNEYFNDFSDLAGGRSLRRLDADAFVEKHLGDEERVGITLGAGLTNDVQTPDGLDRDKWILQRVPDLTLAVLPMALPSFLSQLVGSMNAEYQYFRGVHDERKEFAGSIVGNDLFADVGIDGLSGTDVYGTGNGRFDEGEPLLDRAQRLHLTPRLALPLRIADTVEVLAEVGYNQTIYQSRSQGSAEHGFVTGRMDVRSKLRGTLPGGLVHYLTPYVSYAVVSPNISEDDPMFIPRTAVPDERLRRLDLRNITLDPSDRVESFNGIVTGVENRLYSKGSGPDGASRLLAKADLSLEYQFTGTEFTAAALDAEVYPWERVSGVVQADYDLENSDLSEAYAGMAYQSLRGSSLAVGYRYRRDFPIVYEDYTGLSNRFAKYDPDFKHIHQLNLASRLVLTPQWLAIFGTVYNFESDRGMGRQEGIAYLSRCRCWSIQALHVADATRGSSWRVAMSLSGLGREANLFGATSGLTGGPYLVH